MVAIYDPLGNYLGDDGTVSSSPRPSPAPAGSLNLYKAIAPNAPVVAPMAEPQVSNVADKGPMLSQAPSVPKGPMGMSFVGSGALNQMPAPQEPGALSPTAVPLADTGALSPSSAPRDGGLFSFMDKPGATDSLVAFGSAMLRASNFNEGLANAAQAVNKVAQQYRPLSEVEINNLRQRAEIQAMLNRTVDPPEQQTPTQASVNDNRPVYGNLPGRPREMFYPTTLPDGTFGFTQASSGSFVSSIENALRPEDDAAKYNSKNVAKAREDALTEAIAASSNANKFESVATSFDEAGGGAGYADALRRYSAEALGMDILGVNVSKKQEVDKFLRDLELGQAQTQRGLGQLTEAERSIIREALPSIKDDPRAFKRIMLTMAAQSNRASMLYDRWINDEGLQNKYEDPRQYYRAWLGSDEGKSYEKTVRQDIDGRLSVNNTPSANTELEDALKKY